MHTYTSTFGLTEGCDVSVLVMGVEVNSGVDIEADTDESEI
jgi:hypothetical protein